jgi:hypothetical protein
MFADPKCPDRTWQIPVEQMLKTINEVQKLRDKAMCC